MRRVRLVLLAVALAMAARCACAAPVPDDMRPVVVAFLHTLQDDATANMEAFVGPESWRDARDLVAAFGGCVVISSYRAELMDGSVLHVEIDGHGTTQHGKEVPLPRDWFLRLVRRSGRWLIAGKETGEQQVARALLTASTDAERRRLVEANAEYRAGGVAGELSWAAWTKLYEPRLSSADIFQAQDAALFALELADASGDPRALARAYRALAAISGDPAYVDAMGKRAEASGDCDAIANALFARGNQLNAAGGDGTALLKRAGSLVDDVDDPRAPLKALHNLAVVHIQTGRITEVVDDVLTLTRESAAHRWREGEAAAAMLLADIYLTVGRKELAAEQERRAFALQRAEGHVGWAANALDNAAQFEADLGHYARAIEMYERAVELARSSSYLEEGGPGARDRDVGAFLAQLAVALAKAGRAQEADRALAESSKLVETHAALIAGAETRFAQGRYSEVLDFVEKLAPLIRDKYYGDTAWQALTLRGRALLLLGRRDEAIRDFREAVTVIERRRAELPADLLAREHYFGDRIAPYRELMDALLRNGDADAALAAAEQSKARLLIEAVAFGHSGAMGQEPAADSARLRSTIASLNRALVHPRKEGTPTRAIEAELAEARSRLDRLMPLRWREPPPAFPFQAPDAGALLGRVDAGRTVIEYAVAPDAVDIFIIRGGRLRARRVAVARERLERAADDLHAAVAQQRLDYRRAASRMYRLLLEPIAQWIPPRGSITIVPDDVLWRVPFDVLGPAEGEPLIARHAIAYSPSLEMFEATRSAHSRRTQKLLAFGDPSVALAPLPDARREVRDIAALYGGGTVYVGGEADESRFKQEASSCDVLHIAAHALVDPRWPWYSALLLSPSRQDDGVLEAQELLQLRLRCDLAVLSACSTGEGDVRPGEGVIGLAWALLAAGSRASVVAHWEVDSAASARLMVAFHRHYRNGLPADAALRRAQLELRSDRRYAHPVFWGAFAVIGRP